MYTVRDIMCHGREIPEIYFATAHGDFRNAPMTHFCYGGAETLYALHQAMRRVIGKQGQSALFMWSVYVFLILKYYPFFMLHDYPKDIQAA